MTTTKILVAESFSPSPAGRFYADGPFPGQRFREQLLLPALKQSDKVIVDMTGTEMPGSSFFDEAFAGLIREHGLKFDLLRDKLELLSPRPSESARVWGYIREEADRAAAASLRHG